MIKSYSELTSKEREKLRGELLRINREKKCHYCGIEEEKFRTIWGDKFYGADKRGRRLEVDHINPDRKDIDLEHPDLDNLVFACSLCNMAKSNMFYYDEFIRVGKVINDIWQAREKSGRPPLSTKLKP
jgi:5-methylcytosine-specific restriction endonuclease McrA